MPRAARGASVLFVNSLPATVAAAAAEVATSIPDLAVATSEAGSN